MLNIKEREEQILRYWKDNNVDEKVRKKNANGKRFYFLDGPPYVSGELHPGQIWVKIVKDAFLRYRRYLGLNVHDRAGYDVHGLPIEHRVEESLGIKSKRDIENVVGVAKFIKACRDFADSLIPKMNSDYRRFGVSLDFESAYIPYKNEYIEKGWSILKRADENGFLYSASKPMLFCPHCETVVAQGTLEVEYKDVSDPSIFVLFKAIPDSKAKINVDENTYLLIWTTTPWTLPGHIAAAVNPKALYVKARFGDKRLIIAKERLGAITDLLNESVMVESEFYGSELDGLHYINPLEDKVPKQKEFRKYHKVILAENMVLAGEGTGVVHVAPGHGFEDYQVSKQNKLPIFSPISTHAQYTTDAGSYYGLKVPEEANPKVLHDLKELGVLLYQGTIVHSYPHCWRCDSKLIYLSTDQWFLNIDKIKKKLISENRKTNWQPPQAVEWHESVLQNAPDWVISRQRYWGTPIPIWKCTSCGHKIVIGSKDELYERAKERDKVDALQDLHRPYIDEILLRCPNCGSDSKRIGDVFDVWYDSGVAFRASLNEEEFDQLFPVDFVLEGKDQLRGWFSTLLKSSVITYGKRPFKTVVIDGMMLASDGREMHRKLGNYVSIKEFLTFATADSFRYWCSNHTQWLDIPFSKDELDKAQGIVIMLYNIAELAKEFAAISGYGLKNLKKPSRKALEREDAWILSRLNTLIKTVTESMDGYDVASAASELRNFIVEDFSRVYLKFAKMRASSANRNEVKKLARITGYLLYTTAILTSVVIPFSNEYIYQELFSKEKESIFMNRWPRSDAKAIDSALEEDFKVFKEVSTAILNLREKRNAKLRWPLNSATIETSSDQIIESMERLSPLISMYTNVKSLKVLKGEASKREIKPLFAKLGPSFKEHAKVVADELSKQDAEQVEQSIEKAGSYRLHTKSGTFDILPEHFTIFEKGVSEKGVTIRYKNTNILVDIDAQITAELRGELLAREFIRRVQLMRKELKLTRLDAIEIFAFTNPEFNELLERNKDQIKKVVRARSISIKEKMPSETHSKDWDVLGAKIKIAIKK